MVKYFDKGKTPDFSDWAQLAEEAQEALEIGGG